MRSFTLLLCLLLVGCNDGPLDKRINLPGEARRDARREARVDQPPPPPFDYGAYRTVTDCLNAAARASADLAPCERRKPVPYVGRK